MRDDHSAGPRRPRLCIRRSVHDTRRLLLSSRRYTHPRNVVVQFLHHASPPFQFQSLRGDHGGDREARQYAQELLRQLPPLAEALPPPLLGGFAWHVPALEVDHRHGPSVPEQVARVRPPLHDEVDAVVRDALDADGPQVGGLCVWDVMNNGRVMVGRIMGRPRVGSKDNGKPKTD
jgi:hypothetical protein